MPTFNGGGGTLTATTIPQASLDLIMLLTEREKEFFSQTDVSMRSTWSVDMMAQTSTFSVSIPCIEQLNATGRPEMVAQNYLNEALGAFDPGTGGNLVSTDLVSALVEHTTKFNLLEKQISTIETSFTPNTHNISYDRKNSTATITIDLPIGTIINSIGLIEMFALDFLA